MEITDFEASELDMYARLSESRLLHYHEPQKGIFIAESPMVIQTALDAGYIPISFLVEKQQWTDAAKILTQQWEDVPVYILERELFQKMTGFQMTRGMLCAMRRRELPAAEEVCKHAKRIVVLENVMNPTNVGAIFRSAAALGMGGILLTGGCSDPLYRRAVRVSMGTVFQIPWTFLNEKSGNSKDWISFLQDKGFKVAAMALNETALSIADPRLQQEEKLAIVLGTEGFGLLKETVDRCDYTMKIPMFHGVDSLNVAAASAVAFWQLGFCGSDEPKSRYKKLAK